MKKRTKLIGVGAAAALSIAVGAGVVAAQSDDDGSDTSITGDALKSATDAALAHTGEGRVTGTEVGDEDSYYEVEVTLDDGSQVDVQLDESFTVVSDKVDVETDG
jgi:uncharacterized membrane protein YkoI